MEEESHNTTHKLVHRENQRGCVSFHTIDKDHVSKFGLSLSNPGLVKICLLLRPNLTGFLHCTFYTILGLISLKVYIFTNKINNRKVNSLIRTDRALERKLPELIVVNFLQRNSFHEILKATYYNFYLALINQFGNCKMIIYLEPRLELKP